MVRAAGILTNVNGKNKQMGHRLKRCPTRNAAHARFCNQSAPLWLKKSSPYFTFTLMVTVLDAAL